MRSQLLKWGVLFAALGANACTSTSDEATDCIMQFGNDAMSTSDIETLSSDGLSECFSQADPSNADAFQRQKEILQEQAVDLPVVVGTDARNDLQIEVYYSCSDVCPDAGFVGIRYANVGEAECCELGGVAEFDAAWGGFVACSPPEVAQVDGCG